MRYSKYIFAIILIVLAITACGGNADSIKVNDPAPRFTLQDSEGNSYSLSDYKGKSAVVIYFYPKASTPGCTKQACGIRDDYEKFIENNITVLGISVDSKESLQDFENEYSLNFPLLSDENKEVADAYGVLNNIGLASRITFIINKDGNIANIIRDVDVDSHAEDVFAIASKL